MDAEKLEMWSCEHYMVRYGNGQKRSRLRFWHSLMYTPLLITNQNKYIVVWLQINEHLQLISDTLLQIPSVTSKPTYYSPHSSMYSVKTIVNLYGETLVNLNMLFYEHLGCREKSFCHLGLQTVAILKK